MKTIDLTADTIDVRNIIARVEELREEREDATHDDDGNLRAESFADLCPDEAAELTALEAILAELAEEIGSVDPRAAWPVRHIDWEAAAEELQQDYSSVEVDGTTYWYR